MRYLMFQTMMITGNVKFKIPFFQYPAGRREGIQCDIHWHSAHYHENNDLYRGWVNKFPGRGHHCHL